MKKEFGIAVGGALFRDDKLLVLRRVMTEEFGPGMYELPGGGLEFGESAEAGAEREFKEETGLAVVAGAPFYTWHFIYGETKQMVSIEFFVKDADPSVGVTRSEEHDDTRWVTEEEAYGLPMSPEMRIVVIKAFETRRNSRSQ